MSKTITLGTAMLSDTTDEDIASPSLRDLNDKHVEYHDQIPTLTESQYWLGICALCTAAASQSWLIISVFPYSGFMAIELIDGVNEENAGSYAGMLASAFMAGRAMSSVAWGKIADSYGRRFVLIISLTASCFLSVLFGTASSFPLAVFWRFMMGLCNGLFGTSKTCVSELAQGNGGLETKGMSLMMGMWAWSFLFSPALSGVLSEPVKAYPDSAIVQQFHGFLSEYPFILPNLVSVIMCIFALFVVSSFVPETLPPQRKRSPKYIVGDIVRSLCEFFTSHLTSSKRHNKEETDGLMKTENGASIAYGTAQTESNQELESAKATCTAADIPKATIAQIWCNTDTRTHLIVYWLFSFVVVAVDEGFPLFCISQHGGLGLSEVNIGKILSTSGFIFAVCQYSVYNKVVDCVGLTRSVQIGSIVAGPLLMLIPLSVLLNSSTDISGDQDATNGSGSGSRDNELSWSTYLFLSIVLALYRIFSLMFFSSITVLTNRTVSPEQRGTMNGFSMLGGSLTKGLAPTFVGLLVSFCISSGVFAPRVGAFMVFAILSCMGCGVGYTAYKTM
eukprot:CAMPEP_0198115008 /NCGR_PEP_ID=MMETSP1442-20131203/6217_1 /TAXON_ID= /ORGANISM="Craspedostauros australis, Strain CCMP3328" /LENGTH=561 /DNA_ID=CAMNT_0043772427 /DNA_START=64 /DNA_END=1749 /DNA_ORIENTATION=+